MVRMWPGRQSFAFNQRGVALVHYRSKTLQGVRYHAPELVVYPETRVLNRVLELIIRQPVLCEERLKRIDLRLKISQALGPENSARVRRTIEELLVRGSICERSD